MKQFEPVPEKINIIGKNIVDAAFTVHKTLEPGLLESVYEECMFYELQKRSLTIKKQVPVPIEYRDQKLRTELRLDLLIEQCIIVELKSVGEMNPIYEAQLMTYLRLSKLRLGFLINFNVPLIKDGIKRMVI